MSGTLATPLNKTSLRRAVHERVRAALLSGEIGYGDRITETELAEGLGTSRAPVREALRELEQQGLIVSLGQRGYAVRPITEAELEDLVLLRVSLERLAIRLAIQRSSPEDLKRLDAVVADMKKAERGPRPKLDVLDTAFHETLCELARHERLLDVWRGMRDQQHIALQAMNQSWPDSRGFTQRHALLVDLMRKGQEGKAEAAIEEHILSGIRRLRQTSDEPSSSTR